MLVCRRSVIHGSVEEWTTTLPINGRVINALPYEPLGLALHIRESLRVHTSLMTKLGDNGERGGVTPKSNYDLDAKMHYLWLIVAI